MYSKVEQLLPASLAGLGRRNNNRPRRGDMEHDNQMKGKLAVTFSLAALLGTTFLLFQHFTEERGQAESINALTIAVEELRGRNSQLAPAQS